MTGALQSKTDPPGASGAGRPAAEPASRSGAVAGVGEAAKAFAKPPAANSRSPATPSETGRAPASNPFAEANANVAAKFEKAVPALVSEAAENSAETIEMRLADMQREHAARITDIICDGAAEIQRAGSAG